MELISCHVHTRIPCRALKPKLEFHRWDHHLADSKIHLLFWSGSPTGVHLTWESTGKRIQWFVCNALDGGVALPAVLAGLCPRSWLDKRAGKLSKSVGGCAVTLYNCLGCSGLSSRQSLLDNVTTQLTSGSSGPTTLVASTWACRDAGVLCCL